jgi:hypothetical protein
MAKDKMKTNGSRCPISTNNIGIQSLNDGTDMCIYVKMSMKVYKNVK